MKGKHVLVTTELRGVFFGTFVSMKRTPDGLQVKLQNARNCIYWSADVKGFLGLATTGPTSECKIGPKAKTLILEKVTSIAECNEHAVAAWEKAPWA